MLLIEVLTERQHNEIALSRRDVGINSLNYIFLTRDKRKQYLFNDSYLNIALQQEIW